MVHQKVLDEYKKYDYPFYERAEDENERKFWEIVKGAQKPVKRTIIKIVRLQRERKEWFYYHEALKTADHLGNPHDILRVVGKYEMPQFTQRIDPATGTAQPAEILGHETIYELEWPDGFNDELEQRLKEDPDLVIETQGRRYSGFVLADYKEHSFKDLIMLGRFGTLNPVIQKEIQKRSKINA